VRDDDDERISSIGTVDEICSEEGDDPYERHLFQGDKGATMMVDGNFVVSLLFSGPRTCGQPRLLKVKVEFR